LTGIVRTHTHTHTHTDAHTHRHTHIHTIPIAQLYLDHKVKVRSHSYQRNIAAENIHRYSTNLVAKLQRHVKYVKQNICVVAKSRKQSPN